MTGVIAERHGRPIIGPNTTAAIRLYQQVNGLPVDGFASELLLKRLR